MSNDGWFPDPAGVHELRFFDGASWTEHVNDNGRRGIHHWNQAPSPVTSYPQYGPGTTEQPTTVTPMDSAASYAPTGTFPTAEYPAFGQPGYAGQLYPAAQFGQPAPTPGYATPLGYQAPGYPTPHYQAGFPTPSYSAPAGPPKKGSGLAVMAIVMAVVLVIAGVGILLVTGGDDTPPPDNRAGNTSPSPAVKQPSASPTPDQSPASSPTPAPTQASSTPKLKTGVPTVRVIGPSFAAGEDTYTMRFQGWPFAFRVPPTFECFGGKAPLPDSKAWACIDGENPSGKQRISIMLRPCPTTCTASEQQTMTTAWFDAPGTKPVRKDATTSYLEDSSNERGLYGFDMSHFFGDSPGGPLRWQVGIYVESPTATKASMHKVINEVRTQTP